jgi:hypothetical protein
LSASVRTAQNHDEGRVVIARYKESYVDDVAEGGKELLRLSTWNVAE